MLQYEQLLPTSESGMLGTESHDLGQTSKEMSKPPNILWYLSPNECIRLDPLTTNHTQVRVRQESQTMSQQTM